MRTDLNNLRQLRNGIKIAETCQFKGSGGGAEPMTECHRHNRISKKKFPQIAYPGLRKIQIVSIVCRKTIEQIPDLQKRMQRWPNSILWLDRHTKHAICRLTLSLAHPLSFQPQISF